MPEWTGEVVGKMHVHCISAQALADRAKYNVKYLSLILHGHRTPRGAEKRVKDALEELIEEKKSHEP